MIKNLNYGFKECFIVIFIIILLIFLTINLSKFKSTNDYRGKQIHQGGLYIGKILSTSTKHFDKIQKDEFSKLNQFMIENKLNKNGFPFIIYTSKNQESIQYIIGIPIENCNEIVLPSKFVCNFFPKQDVLTVVHQGYLYDRNEGWRILDNKIAKMNKKIFNAPFEVYWKGLEQTKDSTTWITGLYYPIK